MELDLDNIHSPFVKSSATDLEPLLQMGITKNYPVGTTLFTQGEKNACLYYLRKGTVKITMMHPNGAEKILALHGPGSLLGESAMDGFPHFSCAITTEPSEIVCFPQDLIYRGLSADPHLFQTFVMCLLRKLRLCALQIEDMTFRPAFNRIAHMVHHLSNTYGVPSPRGRRIQMRITNTELGQITATSRITVNKVLNELKTRGVIDFEKRWIVVLDDAALAAIADATDEDRFGT